MAADLVDDVVVSTDDKSIAEEARKCGALVPFIRPQELAGDLSTTEETLQHALLETESKLECRYDICVFLTATDIFRDESWIDAIDTLIKCPELESVFVGYKIHKNFWEKHLMDDGKEFAHGWQNMNQTRRRSIIREDTGLACASRSFCGEGRRIGDCVDVIKQSTRLQALIYITKKTLK